MIITFSTIEIRRKARRVYWTSNLEEAQKFAHLFGGVYVEFFPNVYKILI